MDRVIVENSTLDRQHPKSKIPHQKASPKQLEKPDALTVLAIFPQLRLEGEICFTRRKQLLIPLNAYIEFSGTVHLQDD